MSPWISTYGNWKFIFHSMILFINRFAGDFIRLVICYVLFYSWKNTISVFTIHKFENALQNMCW